MSYGVQPTGYVRKPLSVWLAELEEAMVGVFGEGVIQTEQSPLGQLNGLMADLLFEMDERNLHLYQSFDPDQAEARRLEVLARYRLLTRATGETDQSLRQAITNLDRARIDTADLRSALLGLSGVTYVRVYVNEEPTTDADGIPPNHVSVLVIGGDDAEVAQTVRRYVVPGVGSYGNTAIETTIDGYCRRIKVIRPVMVPVRLEIEVVPRPDKNGCPPPSALSMAAGLYAELTGENRPPNGQDGTEYVFRRALEALYPNIEVVAVRVAAAPTTPTTPPLVISFFQMMSFDLNDIEITVT